MKVIYTQIPSKDKEGLIIKYVVLPGREVKQLPDKYRGEYMAIVALRNVFPHDLTVYWDFDVFEGIFEHTFNPREALIKYTAIMDDRREEAFGEEDIVILNKLKMQAKELGLRFKYIARDDIYGLVTISDKEIEEDREKQEREEIQRAIKHNGEREIAMDADAQMEMVADEIEKRRIEQEGEHHG